jgi:diguanylate cyclase (GGDEF)-like protein
MEPDPMTPSAADTDRHPRPATGTRSVVWLTIGLAVAGAAAGFGVVRLSRLPGQHSGVVTWVLLAAGFAVSEVFVVHVHIRRESHSFSLSEVPLVIGLFLVSPRVLLPAALVGFGLALGLHRRQAPIKLAFNLAKEPLEVAIALAVFRTAGTTGRVPGVAAGLAAVAAMLACALFAGLLVSVVIALSEGAWTGSGVLRRLPMSALGSVMAACLGLVAVVLIDVDPSMLWLLVVPAMVCYGVYAAWTAQSRRMQSVQFLYRTAQVLQDYPSIDDAILALLAETRELLNVTSVQLIYKPHGDGRALQARFTADGDSHVETSDADDVSDLVSMLDGGDGARFAAIEEHEPLRRHFGQGSGVAILAPLTVSDVIIGALFVGPPLSDVGRFDDEERQLVDTTARALSVSLENGSLERSLNQLRTLERQLAHQAYHDSLTQLPNRSRFIDQVAEVANGHEDFAVLFVDLDDFKMVNDSLGHDAGDALLVEVGQRIGGCLRSGDLAARLGGDEFAVLLHPITGHGAAESTAARILSALTQPLTIFGNPVRVSASIGVAVGGPGSDVAELLRGADVAMYRAKAAGKGQSSSFQSAMHRDMMLRYQLLQDVQVAVERGELCVEYQPIVSLSNGMVNGVEALVRWDHPEHGRMTPELFIPLAEETRAIGGITDLVMRDACAQAARLAPTVLSRVSFNASMRDLSDSSFTARVASAIASSGIDARRLVCEVTESSLLTERATETLHALRGIGVGVSLDDFGTGYSSLQVLRQLPLDQLKIAKPFIDDLDLRPEAVAFVRAITTLGMTLGLSVVAEGVERAGQATALRDAGCEYAQGFLFARPVPAGELESHLGTHPLRDATAGDRLPDRSLSAALGQR